jgi:hypothetical protein
MSRRFLPATVSAGSDGAVMVNHGRYHRQAVATAFEMCGGIDRLADWADKNYGEFVTKLFPRLIPKEVEVGTSQGVEDLLRQLDAKTIDITPKEFNDV